MAVLQATTITGGLTMHGMAAGFMKINAEGAVVMDTNTYLSSGSYLALSGGTMTGDITMSGNGRGIYFTGGNNRIYFSGYRALEGSTTGSNLQVGEGFSQIQLQSALTQVDGNLFIAKDGGRLYFDRPNGVTVGAVGWHTNDVFYVAGHPDYGPTAGNSVRVYGFGADLHLGNSNAGDVITINNSGTINANYTIVATGGSGTTPTLVLNRNIATPSNYYNGLQLEVRATSGTAGIGLHRNGYSHVGIYHDSSNELKFNMNSGTVTLPAGAGTLWGSGNLTNLNQLSNGPGYITSSALSSYLPLSGGTLSGTLTIGGAVGSYIWNDGSGTYIEAYGNSTATRKIRIQSANSGATAYAQWFADGGNLQIYGAVSDNVNFLMNSSTVYLRYNGSDKFWTGSDGTRTQGWSYYQDASAGMHWPSNGWHLVPSNSADFRIHSGNASESSLRMETNGTTRGYFYTNSSNEIGILNNSRSWGFRMNSGLNAFIHGQTLTINADNAAWSSIYMNDGDQGMREIHCNSNRIGFLNQSGNWGAWNDDNGNWGMSLNAYMAGNRFDIQGAEGQISFKDGDNVWTGYVGFTGNLGYLSFPGRNVKINSGYNGTITLETGVSGYNTGVVSIPYGRLTVDNSYIYAGTYVEAGSDMRAPIFYDSNNTAYYGNFAGTSRMNRIDIDDYLYASNGNGRIYLGGNLHIDSLNGQSIYLNFYSNLNIRLYGTTYLNGYGIYDADSVRLNGGYSIWARWNTYSGYITKIAYMTFDYNSNNGHEIYHSIASTDINGSYSDAVSLNSYNDITLRLDSNNNNANSYLRISNNSAGDGTIAWIGYESGMNQNYFSGSVGISTGPRTDGYRLNMGGSIHLNGNSVDYVGSLYFSGAGHIQPNSGSYGALQMTGTRNSWAGIRFVDTEVNLMMNSNESGNYRNGYGWQFRWYNGTFYISTSGQGGGSEYTALHSGNYSSWAQPYVYRGQNAGNWQTFTDDVGEFRIDEVLNITGGGHSNYPTGVYTYGGVMSWRLNNHSFQLYASHTGDLTFKTQWGNDNYSGWRRIIHESNISSFALAYGNLTGSFGMNDNKLYLRTNGDTNHYLWNADDDYEELRAYAGTGFRVRSSGGEDLLLVYGASNGGYTYSPYSFRAPIFYDSNDTAYYLNPAGGSRLRNLYVGDSGDDWSDPGGWGTQVRFSNGPHVRFVLHARSPGIEAGMYVHTPGSVYIGSYTSHDVSMMYAGNRKMQITNSYIYTDVYLEAAGSLRAPIFYDSNDTGYYGDFASTSRMNNIMLGSTYSPSYQGQLVLGHTSYNFNFLNGSWASSITAGILANCADEYEFAIHDSGNSVESLFIYQSSTGRILMGRDIGWGTTPIQAAADFRAPIFYDSQDTGYFCDPNSRSRLSSIDYGSSGYYFAAGDWGWRHNTPSGWIQFGPANSGHAHIYTDRSNFYFNVDVMYQNGNRIYGDNYRPYADSAGNADTVDGLHAASFTRKDTSGQYLKAYYEYGNYLTSETPVNLVDQGLGGGGLRVDFMHPSYTGSGGWNHVITWSGYNGYNMYQLGGHYDGGTGTNLWVRSEANHGRTSWTSWRRLLNTSSDPYAANMNQYVRTSDNVSFAQVTASNIYAGGDVRGNDVYTTGGWFRNHTNNNGIYWSSSGFHLYPKDGSDFYVRSGNSDISIHFMAGGGTLRNYIHNASDNAIGFLSTGRSWILRVENGGRLATYGPISRNAHASGFLEGSYNNIGGNSSYTNPIYTIGSNYNPSDSSLNSMYGIGYAHPNFWGSGKTSSWGLYVANGGVINVTLGEGSTSIWAQNDIVAYSDARVKDNIEVVENAVEKIQAIRGVTFTRTDASEKDRNKRHAGVIAQEVLKVLPEVVSGTEEDMYSVAYGNMAALFIEAIKEQQKQIDELKEQLKNR